MEDIQKAFFDDPIFSRASVISCFVCILFLYISNICQRRELIEMRGRIEAIEDRQNCETLTLEDLDGACNR